LIELIVSFALSWARTEEVLANVGLDRPWRLELLQAPTTARFRTATSVLLIKLLRDAFSGAGAAEAVTVAGATALDVIDGALNEDASRS
jgi:hypothetical protein